MEEKFSAVCVNSSDYKDYDKLLTLITPDGVKRAVMRGVKRSKAKLKAGAMPFSFCEYSVAEKSGNYTITGCTVIEDLFAVTSTPEKYVCGSVMLEAASKAFVSECREGFIALLRRLRELIYSETSPYLIAARFLQFTIHYSGYGYTYPPPPDKLTTPIELLSALHAAEGDATEIAAEPDLVMRTLRALIKNFESKFDCKIMSAALL